MPSTDTIVQIYRHIHIYIYIIYKYLYIFQDDNIISAHVLFLLQVLVLLCGSDVSCNVRHQATSLPETGHLILFTAPLRNPSANQWWVALACEWSETYIVDKVKHVKHREGTMPAPMFIFFLVLWWKRCVSVSNWSNINTFTAMLWVEFYSFPLGDKQWHLAIDLPSRTLQQASQPESQETRAARNTEHATNKCRCTLQGTILVHETGQYVNTDNGPNRHNNKKQHQTILQDLTKQVCWSSTRQPAKRNEQFLQSWDKQNPNGHAFEQKGQGRLVVKWCMSNKMFLAHTKINEHPNDWSCGTQEPPSSEDPFAQITCQNIQDIGTYRLFKSFLAPKPNLHLGSSSGWQARRLFQVVKWRCHYQS